jgi:hypothetical protein
MALIAPDVRRRALSLTRKLFASLPFERRLALVLANLLSDSGERDRAAELFGRIIYAEFLRKGIPGVPLPDRTLSERDLADKELYRKLPKGYGLSLGKKAMAILYQVFRMAPNEAEDALNAFYEKWVLIAPKLDADKKLHQAEDWVLTALKNFFTDQVRRIIRKKVREVVVLDENLHDDEGGFSPKIDTLGWDEQLAREIENRLTPAELQRFNDYISRTVHPAMPEYIRLRADGFSQAEIVGNPKKGYPGMIPALKSVGLGQFYKLTHKLSMAIESFFKEMRPVRTVLAVTSIRPFAYWLERESFRLMRLAAQRAERERWRFAV